MTDSARSLTILHTPPRFYPYIGGVENICLDLASRQVQRGHRVKVVCAAHDNTATPTQHLGIQISRLRSLFRVAGTNVTPQLPFQLVAERCDIVHTYLPTPWSADWSVIVAKFRRKPVVVTYCNDIVAKGMLSSIAWLYNLTFLRLLLALSDRIVLISNEGNRLEKLARLAFGRGKVSVIPPGTDADCFVPLPELRQANSIFFLALLDEFHRYKGLDVLIRAMPDICRGNPTAKLIVGGDGSLRPSYEAIALELSVSSNTEFLGEVPLSARTDLYNRAGVFVLPTTDSRQEGFGMVLAEAMACGVPVVTTSAVGMASAIREAEAGFVVPPGDVQGLAKCIGVLLRDRDLATRMGMNGRALVERRFSSKSVSEAYERIYMSCLQR